ncbi:retropepsin-like aspartic protease family protein [Methylobacterium sp. A54F]
MMYAGLAILGLALVLLIATDGSQRIAGGLAPDQLAGLASGTAVLILVTAGFWHRFRDRMGESVRNLLIWAGIFLVAVTAYAYRDQFGTVGARVMGELRPGTGVVGPGGTVTINRRADGDFQVEAIVNGRAQSFAFDTGASAVVLTAENAAALGLRPADNAYTQRVATANGVATVAPVLLDSLTIGPITERRVSAVVSRPGALSGNLLGQSFLSRLPSYEVRGDCLILQGR